MEIAAYLVTAVLVEGQSVRAVAKDHGVSKTWVRPGELYRQIQDLTTQLERMALSKAPAPVKPRVNRAFNPSLHPEVLDEATNQRSRRY